MTEPRQPGGQLHQDESLPAPHPRSTATPHAPTGIDVRSLELLLEAMRLKSPTTPSGTHGGPTKRDPAAILSQSSLPSCLVAFHLFLLCQTTNAQIMPQPVEESDQSHFLINPRRARHFLRHTDSSRFIQRDLGGLAADDPLQNRLVAVVIRHRIQFGHQLSQFLRRQHSQTRPFRALRPDDQSELEIL